MSKAMENFVKSAVMALFLLVATTGGAGAEVRFEQQPLTIVTADGVSHAFTAELALDEAQREQGLMRRTTMAPDAGMLFDFGKSRDVMMWMHDTVLPLDMLFIDKAGTVTRVHENAVPFSDAIISSHGPIKYVLELNAGRAKALGLRAGDKVLSKQIGTAN
jgi:uncharacterized membrane protein (UPF0127 family)